MLSNTILALSFLPVSLAHFQLNYPTARGFSESQEGTFPCGGYNDVQAQRTDFPISGGAIQLNLGHEQTNVAVYMAVGSNPGSSFNTVVRQQFMVNGYGNFCIGQISVPAGMNVSDGTQATIQVMTNGEGGGGLYQCTDVTLRNAPMADYDSHCKNNTGISVSQQNIAGNPNGTSTAPGPSGTSAAPSQKTGAASHVNVASWAMGAVGVACLAML